MYPVKEGADIAYDPEKSWSIDDVKWRARGGGGGGGGGGSQVVELDWRLCKTEVRPGLTFSVWCLIPA